MKKLLFVFLFTFPIMVFGQSMNIKWEDRDGREFSINNQTSEFKYTMVPGDKIKYITQSWKGPVGSVESIGGVKIKYITQSWKGPVGSVESIGGVEIKYITQSWKGPVGYIQSVGGLEIKYITQSWKGPIGSVESTSGRVL
jgi:hypothetical protein